MTVKPIETPYKGYRFRSRLEARWAVYFDAVGLEWEYEKEGFDLGAAGYYLPDFWLPQANLWAEVKPGELSSDEIAKALRLKQSTGFDVIMLIGTPAKAVYKGIAGNGYGLLPYKSSIFDTSLRELDYAHLPFRDWPNSEKLVIGAAIASFKEIDRAVETARSARFEHGESPRGKR